MIIEKAPQEIGIVDIATVADGIQYAQGACHGAVGGEELAPGVVGVGDYVSSGGVQDRDYVSLQIGGVVIRCSVVDDGNRGAGYIDRLSQAVRSCQPAFHLVYLCKPPLVYHIQRHLSTSFRLSSPSHLALFNKRSPDKKQHSCTPLSQDTTVLLFSVVMQWLQSRSLCVIGTENHPPFLVFLSES